MEIPTEAKYPNGAFYITALVVALIGGGAYYSYRHERTQARQRCETQIAGWSDGAKMMTMVMMERYGPPEKLSPETATWYERTPWKRIVVHGDGRDGFLEQAVGYQTSPKTVKTLEALGIGVRIDAVNDELSSQSGSESLNFLALNLANEVVYGGRSAEEARQFYMKTAGLAASGKASPYMMSLQFKPYTAPLAGRWGERYAY